MAGTGSLRTIYDNLRAFAARLVCAIRGHVPAYYVAQGVSMTVTSASARCLRCGKMRALRIGRWTTSTCT